MVYPGKAGAASLSDVSLEIRRGESVGVVGRSGSGKSTLLNILAALLSPTRGRYLFDGEVVGRVGTNSPSTIRLRRGSGYISQSSDLISNLDVFANVKLAAACRRRRVANDEALHSLEAVGLVDKARAQPSELSGGERQRVNIARAMLCRPEIVFADEPTGALDLYTSRRVLDLMHRLTRETGTTLILVTHVPAYATDCTRQLCLSAGRLYRDTRGMAVDALTRFITANSS